MKDSDECDVPRREVSPIFSTCDLQDSGIIITLECVRNAESQAPPVTSWAKILIVSRCQVILTHIKVEEALILATSNPGT